MHAVFGVCIVDAAPPSPPARLTGKALRFADCRGAFSVLQQQGSQADRPGFAAACAGREVGGGGGERKGAALLCPGPGSGSTVPLLRAGDAACHGHQPGPCCCSSVQQLRAAPLGAGDAAARHHSWPVTGRCCCPCRAIAHNPALCGVAHSRAPAAHNDWLCAGAAAAAEGHNSPACCRYPLRISSAALPGIEPSRRCCGVRRPGRQDGASAASSREPVQLRCRGSWSEGTGGSR